MVKVERINLQKEGLTKFFSPNEAKILELLWEEQAMTSGEISKVFDDLSHAVVAGTLDRLVKSGFVERKLDEGGNRLRYIYSAVGGRDDVGLRISERVIDSLFETFGDATLNALGKARKGGRTMEGLECFYVCLTAEGLIAPMVGVGVLTGLLFITYFVGRGFKPLLGAQLTMTGGISVVLLSMECYMASWVWIYLGLIGAGAAAMVVARTLTHRSLKRTSLGSLPALADLENEFGMSIVILDTQRTRALAYRGRVYLSVGLIERLEEDELRAVVAHEVYHLKTSPPKLLSFLLGLTSLTFLRYRDETAADIFAASVTSPEAIIGALQHLEIRDHEERAQALANT